MKNKNLNNAILFLIVLLTFTFSSEAQFEMLIPDNTATHIAVKNGPWSKGSTWNTGTVPGLSAIVIIPNGISVNYNVNSDEHIFAIRNDGRINIFSGNNGSNRKLIVDTFVNSSSSFLNINARRQTSGNIEIVLKPFDIESKKNGSISGATWSQQAKNHYEDGLRVNNHFGEEFPDDGPGVLGRHSWDPKQVSISLMTRGRVKIIGFNKTDFLACSGNITKGQNSIDLVSIPNGWKVGDQIMLTGTESKQKAEVFNIESINGNTITIDSNEGFEYNHIGLSSQNLFAHTANMTRNVIIRSFHTDRIENITQRGHSMFMLNGDIRIENTAFIELGRTDKGNIIDDFKYNVEVSGNRKNASIKNLDYNATVLPQNIENQRGRYAFHFHKSLRGLNSNKLIIATGNVVWGSPGWGMVHHDSHANFTDNVIYQIAGGGMIAESGSETGIWKNNLVAAMAKGRRPYFLNTNFIPGPLRLQSRNILDDDFRGSAAFGLQSRAVRMVDNVASGAGVAFHYQATGEQVPTADKVSTAKLKQEIGFDAFPLETTIERSAPALVEFKNNTAYHCRDAFKSQERHTHAYHRVQSVIKNMKAWNTTRFTIYINNNFGYTFQDSYFHTKSDSEATAVLMQSQADNLNWSKTTFEGFQFRTLSIVNGNNTHSNNHSNSEFVFHDVTWINSKPNPYDNIFKGTANVISGPLPNNPVIFTRKANMDVTIDIPANDFKIGVEGTVTDNAGVTQFANYTPNSSPKLKRVYDFKNEDTLNDYLDTYGVMVDNQGKNYTLLTEYISDRVTGEVTPIEFRIFINGLDNVQSSEATENLKDLEADSFLKVDQNPTENEILKISQKGGSYLQIINMLGILIKEIPISGKDFNQIDLDISGIPSGTYIIKSDKDSQKFIIKH